MAATWTCARPSPATRRFESLQPAGARGLCRPVEEPDRRGHPPLPARPGARMRRRGRARRDALLPASRSTPPKAAPCCTPRCARRAAPGRSATRCTACSTHAGLRRAGARRRRAITDIVNIGIGGSDLGPADGGAGAGRLCPPGCCACTSSATSTATTSCPCCAAGPRRTLFIVASKTFTTQETMANAHGARSGSWTRAAPTSPPLRRHHHQREGGGGLRHHTTFGFWDWVGGRYSLWSAIGLPIAIAVGADATSARCWPARMRWTGTSPRRRWPTCRCSWACWTSGTATSTASPAAAWRPTTRACAPAGLPAAAGDGKQRQVRGP
jgi:hypothetical protein